MPTERTMGVDERLERLESAVARIEAAVTRGFGELTSRMDGFDARMDRVQCRRLSRMDGFDARMDRFDQRLDAMNNKIDVTAESLRGDMKRVLEVVGGVTEHLDRTIDNIRKEHDAERRLMYATLKDHRSRLARLEDIVADRN